MVQPAEWEFQDDPCPAPVLSPAREQALLCAYLPLVKRAASHLRSQVSATFAREDLEQVGMMGLLEALRRYGGEPDAQFESYAFKRIRGAILDELRRLDWRPRQIRQQAHDFNQVARTLYNRLGRTPSEQELADEMQVSLDELRDFLYASQAEAMHSLDELLDAGSCHPAQENCAIGRLEQQRAMRQALEQLPKREQLLLTLYYQHELNMKEIALTLDLTESRVCQLHKQAIQQLNQLLADLL
jgi:RNA polymerase sigma factor, FliA/WhiG family